MIFPLLIAQLPQILRISGTDGQFDDFAVSFSGVELADGDLFIHRALNRVGINTTGPLFTLDIVGNRIRLGNGAARTIQMRVDGAATDLLSTGADLNLRSTGGDNNIVMNPFPNDVNVGIGTFDPTELLHLRQDDGSGAGFRLETINAPANGNWFFQQNHITGAFLVTPTSGGAGPFQVFPGPANLIAGTLVVRNGRVGIGTQAPSGTLDVNGAIFQRGVVRHPDYVFEKSYNLETIEDHEGYMWTNKHLPAIGAGQYDSDGLAVIEMGARSQGVLEELEKAHIYIAQLNQEIIEQNKAIEVLKKSYSNEIIELRKLILSRTAQPEYTGMVHVN